MVSIIIPRFDFIIILVTKMMNMHLWRSRFTYCNYMNNVNKRYKGSSKQIKYLINHTDFPIRISNRLEIRLRSLSVLNAMKHFSYNYDHFYCFIALISTSLPSFLFTRKQNGVQKKVFLPSASFSQTNIVSDSDRPLPNPFFVLHCPEVPYLLNVFSAFSPVQHLLSSIPNKATSSLLAADVHAAQRALIEFLLPTLSRTTSRARSLFLKQPTGFHSAFEKTKKKYCEYSSSERETCALQETLPTPSPVICPTTSHQCNRLEAWKIHLGSNYTALKKNCK